VLDDFTYGAYRDLIGRVRQGRENVCLGSFAAGPAPRRYFILRHDVDFCPRRAEAMAALEAEMGVRATYFFLLSSPHYSLLAEPFCRTPRRIAAMGHEIGLHYDIDALAAAAGAGKDELFRQQVEVLERVSGSEIAAVALHGPSFSGEGPPRGVERFVDAYDPRFTREIAYVSDSAGAWRDETFRALTGDDLPARLQLLIHPFFWGDDQADRWVRLAQWAEERRQWLAEAVRQAEGNWRIHPAVAEHDGRLKER